MPASNSSPPTDGRPGDGAPPAPPAAAKPLGLFDAYGVEIEYMLVDAETFDVAPGADELLEAAAGEHTDEFENGPVAWNNELALHVIEFKCNGPRPSLDGLDADFAANVALANSKLDAQGCRLMPTAMHPWMDPNDVELWPHGTREIYDAFDRIFGCKGHGWANLQSMQINLPFAGDEEFGRLHAAIRFLLPILPGLAASSPILDGQRNGILDNRLVVYRGNCAKIPSITGDVVPEPMGSIGEYHERLLERIYRDLAPHDPERVLRHEWVNARGAIARFDRMAIEIRVLDVQETPFMDVAYAALIVEVLKLLVEERWADRKSLDKWPTEELGKLLGLTERQAETAGVGDRRYLRALGLDKSGAELKTLWEHLIETVSARGTLSRQHGRFLEHYLRHGSLATRINKAVGLLPTHAKLRRVYEELCEALASGAPFAPPPPRR
ncbi:MAG TPA: glutamate-cysteine ligase family protein [Gammaproteobacteria bacterium]|nr:glutamate-cysteine ligase family protein [Gammaproteobacteria bacterium]